jgi:hydrogenase nickel incorporation protein HypA/HybF
MLDAVEEAAKGRRVTRIVMEVGVLTAVLPDALRFAFDLASAETLAAGAELAIEQPPGRARCAACAAELTFERPFGRCDCGGTDLTWLSGEELSIKTIEVA